MKAIIKNFGSGYVGSIPSIRGMVVQASAKQDAVHELAISLRVMAEFEASKKSETA